MNRIDFIKRFITEGTITRDQELSYKETEVYYNDIVQALNIENFPLISINTIEKKTYMLQESNGQCYLVFDHYLLEYMHLLNQFVIEEDKSAGQTNPDQDILKHLGIGKFIPFTQNQCHITNGR